MNVGETDINMAKEEESLSFLFLNGISNQNGMRTTDFIFAC